MSTACNRTWIGLIPDTDPREGDLGPRSRKWVDFILAQGSLYISGSRGRVEMRDPIAFARGVKNQCAAGVLPDRLIGMSLLGYGQQREWPL